MLLTIKELFRAIIMICIVVVKKEVVHDDIFWNYLATKITARLAVWMQAENQFVNTCYSAVMRMQAVV